MRYQITNDTTASVTLTAREADLVRTARVPLIYGQGGMGPYPVETAAGPATVAFGGAVFVDSRARLVESVGLFQSALRRAR